MARLSCGKFSNVNPKIHAAPFSRRGFLPNALTGHVKWRNIEDKNHSLPGEVRDPIGSEWFPAETDQPRPDAEPLGMCLASVSRRTNLFCLMGERTSTASSRNDTSPPSSTCGRIPTCSKCDTAGHRPGCRTGFHAASRVDAAAALRYLLGPMKPADGKSS